MEIERKFIIQELPKDLETYPSYEIEQAYLCKQPTIRVRRNGEDGFTMTYKSGGMMAHEEYELPLTKEAFESLKKKTDGKIILKRRYKIPLEPDLLIELDVFSGEKEGLFMAEVEFPTMEAAEKFTPPAWFGREVTHEKAYHNVTMALGE